MTFTRFYNHDIDDQKTFFSGRGIEAYLDFDATPAVRLHGSFSWLQPDGSYRLMTITPAISWKFLNSFALWGLWRVDLGRNADGSPGNRDSFAVIFQYNF